MIRNAIENTNEGSIYIEYLYNKNEQKIKVRVKDTGVGVDPDIENDLFRIHNSFDYLYEKSQIS